MSQNSLTIFNFTTASKLEKWWVVDDNVMGGVSEGKISVNEEGHGVFEGRVSLENNGGFSSLRFDCGQVLVENRTLIELRIKGDGKDYQLRIKDKKNHSYSYILSFKTTGEWETVSISLKDMYPTFRGDKLDLPNFKNTFFEEIAILIGNKKSETFKLLIDKITID